MSLPAVKFIRGARGMGPAACATVKHALAKTQLSRAGMRVTTMWLGADRLLYCALGVTSLHAG